MVAAHSGGLDIWVLLIYFQKSNIGWPRQPPTERVPKCTLIFYESTDNPFFKHQNKVKFDIKLLKYAASLTSAASMASKAFFPQKSSWSWWFHPPLAPKMTITGPFLWIHIGNSLLIFGNLSVRGCWGGPMLLFWK